MLLVVFAGLHLKDPEYFALTLQFAHPFVLQYDCVEIGPRQSLVSPKEMAYLLTTMTLLLLDS